MVTDEMLQEAAGEAERTLLASLLGRDTEPHQFSGRFENKMEKLIWRVKHPIRYSVIRYVAAVLIVIMTLFGVLFSASPEVRANVINWFKTTFGIFTQYTPADATPTDMKYDYVLTGLDDDALVSEIDRENGKLFIYKGEGKSMIKFSYTYGSDNNEIFIESDGYEVSTTVIGTASADIYISKDGSKNSAIVWFDEEGNAILHISANADKKTLIELANSVQKKEK